MCVCVCVCVCVNVKGRIVCVQGCDWWNGIGGGSSGYHQNYANSYHKLMHIYDDLEVGTNGVPLVSVGKLHSSMVLKWLYMCPCIYIVHLLGERQESRVPGCPHSNTSPGHCHHDNNDITSNQCHSLPCTELISSLVGTLLTN